jgi:hypothetical protein
MVAPDPRREFERLHRYPLAGAMLALAVLLLAARALFLDAATHGWDDLKLLWLG